MRDNDLRINAVTKAIVVFFTFLFFMTGIFVVLKKKNLYMVMK